MVAEVSCWLLAQIVFAIEPGSCLITIKGSPPEPVNDPNNNVVKNHKKLVKAYDEPQTLFYLDLNSYVLFVNLSTIFL
jgi:hypothetical protein